MTGALELQGPPDMGESARRLANQQALTRRKLQEGWAAQRGPEESFYFEFKAGWRGCGEAMAAIDGFGARGVSWSHDPPWHRVDFSATQETASSMKAAIEGAPVLALRSMRVGKRDRIEGRG